MASGFTELHDDLRQVARDVLGRGAPRPGEGLQPAPVPADVLASSGWSGLEVPETLDGAGATFAETAVVLEELGRFVSMSPMLGSVVLGVGALGLLEATPGSDELQAQVANGTVRLAVAAWDGADVVSPSPAFRLTADGSGARVDGRVDFVVDAPDADVVLVVAQDDHSAAVIAVGAGDPSLGVVTQPLVDASRTAATVTANGLAVDPDRVWRFAGDDTAALRRLYDRAALAVACDGIGVAKAMLDATVAYAAVRQQFDRPIGSFQAVKHQCADMLVSIQVAEILVSDAIDALVGDDPDASVAVSRAAARAGDVAVEVAGTAMQLHGGIGYTWESGVHCHLKRAMLDRSLFGSPAAHRRAIAQGIVAAGRSVG
jgi:alkylation response protein AidB-like acyl-CoA dehydrogenase